MPSSGSTIHTRSEPQPDRVVGALLGQHSVVRPLGRVSASIRKSWDRLSPAAFRSAALHRRARRGRRAAAPPPAVASRAATSSSLRSVTAASQQLDDRSASSSGVRSGVSRRSGFFGRWYGLSIPVKWVISPARALAYRPFGIPPFAVLQRGVAEHLEEFEARFGGHLPRQLAVLLQRADRRHQHDLAGIGEDCGDVGQPAQVLGAVGHRETEVGVEAVPQVVTVENICRGSPFRAASARRASPPTTCPIPTGR